MSLVAFLLALGATARITRFVNRDSLAAELRVWVAERWGVESHPATFVVCPWCVSIWAGAGCAAAAYWWGDRAWFVVPAVALTLSWVYSIAQLWLDEE